MLKSTLTCQVISAKLTTNDSCRLKLTADFQKRYNLKCFLHLLVKKRPILFVRHFMFILMLLLQFFSIMFLNFYETAFIRIQKIINCCLFDYIRGFTTLQN